MNLASDSSWFAALWPEMWFVIIAVFAALAYRSWRKKK